MLRLVDQPADHGERLRQPELWLGGDWRPQCSGHQPSLVWWGELGLGAADTPTTLYHLPLGNIDDSCGSMINISDLFSVTDLILEQHFQHTNTRPS